MEETKDIFGNPHKWYDRAERLKKDRDNTELLINGAKAPLRVVSKTGFAADTKLMVGDTELSGVTNLVIDINAERDVITAHLTLLVPSVDIEIKGDYVTITRDMIEAPKATPGEIAEVSMHVAKSSNS
jgi:hypothetical protein